MADQAVTKAELWGSELVFTTKPLSLEPGPLGPTSKKASDHRTNL